MQNMIFVIETYDFIQSLLGDTWRSDDWKYDLGDQ